MKLYLSPIRRSKSPPFCQPPIGLIQVDAYHWIDENNTTGEDEDKAGLWQKLPEAA